MLRPAKGKAFHLSHYGLEVHLPAVNAELCLEDGVASSIHNMLARIRAVKQGTHKGKLRASAAPLPKREPWYDILAPGPNPIMNILTNRRDKMHDNIMIRGERGDHREQRPQFFFLKCSTCGNFRNCAHVKLFTTTARGLTCSKCKKSTSSTRWFCEHGTPWTRCTEHRETGFRCGVQSLPFKHASSKGTNTWARSFKAIQRRQARLRVIGSLGEPKRLHPPLEEGHWSNKKKG